MYAHYTWACRRHPYIESRSPNVPFDVARAIKQLLTALYLIKPSQQHYLDNALGSKVNNVSARLDPA